jgi:glycosyltransferase involved in cell wall biosynthesis
MLTYAAQEYLYKKYPQDLTGQLTAVIPTCADMSRFVPAREQPSGRVIGCLGTLLSGWFLMDWLRAFIVVGAKRDPRIQFELTTRDDPDKVRAALGVDVEMVANLSIKRSPFDRVQEVLQTQIGSAMFYAGGEISELGRCPTRMAEILGCGLPVITNDGIGDVSRIIREHRVGVLVRGPSEEEMNAAWDELELLLKDPNLTLRCRRAATTLFALEVGITAYASLYDQVLGRSREN